MKQTQKGFTIIELIVVIAIIAVLAGIISVNTSTYLKKSKIAAAKAELNQIGKALQIYKTKYNCYPDFNNCSGSGSTLACECCAINADCYGYDTSYSWPIIVQVLINEKIIANGNAVAKDPWGKSYLYDAEYQGCTLVYSFGPDGYDGYNWNYCGGYTGGDEIDIAIEHK